MGIRPSLLILLLATIAVAGCGGGGGNKTFKEDGFDISFEYPSDFNRITSISVNRNAGATAKAKAGRGIDGKNGVFVLKYDLNLKVTNANLPAIEREFDKLLKQATGKAVRGRPVEIGGLPGIRYEPIPVSQPVGATDELVLVFVGSTEYQLNCQSVSSKRAKVDAACRLAVRTLKKRD